MARLARFLGLPASLAEAVRLQRLQRGCRAAQRLLALLYAACAGGGCLRAMDALGADRVAHRACGLRAGPPSRRLGASLQRRNRAAREGLPEGARLVSRRLTPLGARDCERRWGYVPVCVGGPDGQGEGREQLDRDVAPLPPESRERAPTGAYQPAGWPKEQVYVGIRRDWDREQRWLVPVSTVILVSQDRLPLAELVRLPCGQQGQEHAFQGPWTDLGLQHPPCRSPAAQQGFYLGAQIAQLRRLLQYQVLPVAARRPGWRPLIRSCVCSVGRLTCSARRLRLLCSRGHLHWDRLLHAARRLPQEPLGSRPASWTAPCHSPPQSHGGRARAAPPPRTALDGVRPGRSPSGHTSAERRARRGKPWLTAAIRVMQERIGPQSQSLIHAG